MNAGRRNSKYCGRNRSHSKFLATSQRRIRVMSKTKPRRKSASTHICTSAMNVAASSRFFCRYSADCRHSTDYQYSGYSFSPTIVLPSTSTPMKQQSHVSFRFYEFFFFLRHQRINYSARALPIPCGQGNRRSPREVESGCSLQPTTIKRYRIEIEDLKTK